MKARYEYILIDSRTGVSDASGICTVQLPDVLVVLFTLNNQSIDGASGVARSVQAQRGDSLTILPVPTRIENAEKDKRDLRRERAMRQFGQLLHGTDQEERMAYWGDVAVLYEPYYAYEELMAAFRDEPGSAHSILASAEHLTRRIAGRDLRAVRVNPQQRAAVLASYEGTAPARPEPAEGRPGWQRLSRLPPPRLRACRRDLRCPRRIAGLRPRVHGRRSRAGSRLRLGGRARHSSGRGGAGRDRSRLDQRRPRRPPERRGSRRAGRGSPRDSGAGRRRADALSQ